MRKLFELLAETRDAATEQLPVPVINTPEILIPVNLRDIPIFVKVSLHQLSDITLKSS